MSTTGNVTVGGTLGATGAISPSSFAGVQYVNPSGGEIGAQINTLYAALPSAGGRIVIPPKSDGTPYTMTTQVTFTTLNKPCLLEMLSPGTLGNAAKTAQTGSCINWTATTAGAAFVVDWGNTGGDTSYGGSGGFYNFVLINNQNVTNGGAGSSAVGIQVGGTNGGARGLVFQDSSIMGFGKGIQFHSSDSTGVGWGMNFFRGSIAFNTTGISYERASVGENDNFFGVKFVSNGKHIDVPASKGMDISIYGGSLDSASTCGISSAGTLAYINAIGVHWENNGATTNVQYVCDSSASVQLKIFGGTAYDDASGGTSAQNWFSAAQVNVNGMGLSGGTGGRTYTGKVFNLGDNGYVSVFNGNSTAFTNSNICATGVSGAPCLLNNVNHTNPSFTIPWKLEFGAYAQFDENAAPSGSAGNDLLWGDSTAHRLKMNNNNGGAAQVVAAGIDINNSDQVVATHLIVPLAGDSTSGSAARLTNNNFVLLADFTTASSTSLQTITGLSWTLAANLAQNVSFECDLMVSQATVVADSFGIQAATFAPTRIDAAGWFGTATTAQTFGNLVNLNTTTATAIVTATPTVTTVNGVRLSGVIQNPSNASTQVINIMLSQSTGANLQVVKAGSRCRIW